MPQHKLTGIFLVGSAVALRALSATLVTPVFSLYALNLTTSKFLVGLASGIYGLVQAFLEIPLGVLSDRIGRKRVLIIGKAFFFAGAVLLALAPTIAVVLFARMLQGVGATGSVLLSFVADSTEKDQRGRALSFINILFSLSFLLGMVAGPALTGWVGLRGLFWVGAALVGPGILLIVLVREGSRTPRGRLRAGEVWELLSNRLLLGVNLSALLANYKLGSMFFLLPLVLNAHLEVKDFWQFTLPMVVSGVLALMVLSRWIDRERRKEISMASGLSLLTGVLLPLAPGYPFLLIGYSLFFIGFAVELTLLGSLTTLLPPQENSGLKSGLFSVFQSSGLFFGGSLTGLAAQWGIAWGYLSLGVVAVGFGLVKMRLLADLRNNPGAVGRSHRAK